MKTLVHWFTGSLCLRSHHHFPNPQNSPIIKIFPFDTLTLIFAGLPRVSRGSNALITTPKMYYY